MSYSVQAWYVSKPTSEALIIPFLDQNLLAATKQSGMFCRPCFPSRTCAIAASPSGHSQDCFSHRPSHFLLQTICHSELPRKLPGEKPMRTNVFPLWFVPKGSHNTVQTHHISVRGGKYLARLCMLFFNGPLLFVFFSLLLPPCFGCFLLHIHFFLPWESYFYLKSYRICWKTNFTHTMNLYLHIIISKKY